MLRTGHRRSLTIAAATVALAVALPAAANAKSITVNPADGACGADNTCSTLVQAAAIAVPGDVVTVANGIYASAEFTAGGVTVVGSPSFAVDGTLTFSGADGGVSKLQKAIISQQNGTNPGVAVGGGAGLEISDSAVLSVNGHGALFTAGTANKIVRSVIASGGQTTAGVRTTSNGSGDKSLLVESSILTGGGAGLDVNTSGSSAGDVDVTLRHVTAAGSNGLVLDASNAAVLLSGAVGDISADVTDSIVVNGTVSKESPALADGLLGLIPGNTVTSTYTRSLNGGFNPDTVFVNPSRRNYRLKAGSPAINAGGFTPGESTTDIDGEDRSAAPTDQGGDEYNPAPPPANTPTGTPVKGDGVAPAIVIKSPKHNQRIKITTTKTKITKKKLKNGTTTTTKKKTTKRTPISISGTATDAAGIKGVIVTIQRTSAITSKKKSTTSAKASQATTKKCYWLDDKRGIKKRSCDRPILMLAKVDKDGSWKLDISKKLRFSPARFRIIVLGGDNSGAVGNTAAAKDAIHKFSLVRK
ncbi:MAG: hypothetical protein WKF48_05575 [Solirubrobacteraceae bacterium]